MDAVRFVCQHVGAVEHWDKINAVRSIYQHVGAVGQVSFKLLLIAAQENKIFIVYFSTPSKE